MGAIRERDTKLDKASPPATPDGTPCTFWMVWSRAGGRPRVVHDSYEVAVGEAQRLMALHPGRTFIVMEARTKFRVPNPAEIRP